MSGDELLHRDALPGRDVALAHSVLELGTIGGSGGCNGLSGTIDAGDDGSLALTGLAITEMACEPFEIMEFESAYFDALTRVDGWEVTPGVLTFHGDGVTLAYDEG